MEDALNIVSSAADMIDITNISTPVWGDPKLWIIISIGLVILTAILIYYKLLTGETRNV